MIALVFPDGARRELNDDEARQLADSLWQMSRGKTTATVAMAIQQELRSGELHRQSVAVSERNAYRVGEALAQLRGGPLDAA